MVVRRGSDTLRRGNDTSRRASTEKWKVAVDFAARRAPAAAVSGVGY